jgi:hypothetical protein
MFEKDMSGGACATAAPHPSNASATPDESHPDKSRRTAMRRFDIAAAIIFWTAIVVVSGHMLLTFYPMIGTTTGTNGMTKDFAVFWSAAKLALAGQPLAAFDPQALAAVAELPNDGLHDNFLWLYPPSFLAALMPLGALPFPVAYPAFMVISATAFAFAMRAPASVLPGLWRLMLVSPVVVIISLFIGQTSVLWTAGLVAGLWAMRGGKAAAAGLAIALLTMKPQLGLLIPVALIAARQWAVIGWATGFTVLLTGAATVVTGPGYWPLFFETLNSQVGRVADGTTLIHMISSLYGFLRALGADHGGAFAPQLVLTAGLAVMIGWVWSQRGLSEDLKCATLCAAIPLAAQYALFYEMTLELAAAMFLIRDGFGRRLAGKAWLLVLWFGPAPMIIFPDLTLAICLARVRRRLSTARADGPAQTPCPTQS